MKSPLKGLYAGVSGGAILTFRIDQKISLVCWAALPATRVVTVQKELLGGAGVPTQS